MHDSVKRLSPVLRTLAIQGEAFSTCASCHRELSREESRRPCRRGYHGKHTRVRFRSKSRSHGTMPRKSGQKGGQHK